MADDDLMMTIDSGNEAEDMASSFDDEEAPSSGREGRPEISFAMDEEAYGAAEDSDDDERGDMWNTSEARGNTVEATGEEAPTQVLVARVGT